MAFLSKSRYHEVETVDATDARGRDVTAVRLRRLGRSPSSDHTVAHGERLDIIANRRFDDSTRFWHIADANSEIEANRLVSETGRTIQVPEQS